MADVNAVQPTMPEQKPSKAIPATMGALTLGSLGATGGYFLGGKRPSLEEVFTQQPDVFTSEKVTNIDADAAKVLENAADEYQRSLPKEEELAEEVAEDVAEGDTKPAEEAKPVDETPKTAEETVKPEATTSKPVTETKPTATEIDINKIPLSEIKKQRADVTALKNYTEAMNKYAEKVVIIDGRPVKLINMKLAMRKADKALQNAKTDAEKQYAQAKLNKVKSDLNVFMDATKPEREEMLRTKKAVFDSRVAKLLGEKNTIKPTFVDAPKFIPETPKETINSVAEEAVDSAKDTVKEAAEGVKDSAKEVAEEAAEAVDGESGKLKEIINRDEVKEAYETVKKGLPKVGRMKAAGIYGGIAAAVGLLAGLMFGGSKKAEVPVDATAQPVPEQPADVAQAQNQQPVPEQPKA